MHPSKLTFADVLKSSSSYLNPGLPVRPLIPKAPRTRLSESAKEKLRAAIRDKPISEPAESKDQTVLQPEVKPGKPTKCVKPKCVSCKESALPSDTNCSQPLVLAKASDWIMHGGVMSAAIYGEKKPSSTVRKLKSEEIGSVVREGMKENPIDVCDD